MNKITIIILLHSILLIYSISGILSKYAAGENFLSINFCFIYSLIILILFVYSICWQQIIKRLDLTFAFANKSITVVWGIVWGTVFFDESVTLGKVIGAILIMLGVVIFSISDRREKLHG